MNVRVIINTAVSLLLLIAAPVQALSADKAVCRDERSFLQALRKEEARLSARFDAIEGLLQGTLASNIALDDVFGTVGDGGEDELALPGQLLCTSLQTEYQPLRKDVLWLRQRIQIQQQNFWQSQTPALREGLNQLWSSRQQLQLAWEQLQVRLDQLPAAEGLPVLQVLGQVHTDVKSLRLQFLQLLPALGKRLTPAATAAFVQLWEDAFMADSVLTAAVDEPLQDLPESLQLQVSIYLARAEKDVLQLRSLLNHVRAWMWSQHPQAFDVLSHDPLQRTLSLVLLEGYAISNALHQIVNDMQLAYRERAAGEASWWWMVVLISEYALGLALFPLLLWLARRLARPAATLHAAFARASVRSRLRLQVSRLLAGVPPLIPLLAGWFGLHLLGLLFAHYELTLLIPLVPLARLYILYGLVFLAGEWLLQRIAAQAGVYLGSDQVDQIESYARSAAGTVILPWLLKDLVAIAIGPSLLFSLTQWLSGLAFWMAISVLLRRRRQDVVVALQSFLPPRADASIEKILNGRLFLVLVPLTIPPLLMAFVSGFIDKAMVDFDWYRKLSARGFKMRAQSGADGEDVEPDLPEDYRRWFMAPPGEMGLPFIDAGLFASIRRRLDPWLEDKSEENTLLVTGERGMGKSVALARLGNLLTEGGLRVCYVDVPAKTATSDAVNALIGSALGTDLSEGPAALVKSDVEREPTLIILDNAQNFFLRRVGGLGGWQTLLGLTNARVSNVFWLISINDQSWAYLSNVFGRDYRFRNILRAKPWSQNDIRSMILSRNQLSGFKIRYDDILLASRGPDAGNIRNAEQRYFSLLWDACRGNPMMALRLWLSSVYVDAKTVVVGLPEEISGLSLEQLGNELHFVYAALIIHENMTSDELVQATSLSDSVVRSALKIAFDAGFVQRAERGRYQVVPLWYHTITKLLTRKNLLHE